MKYVITKTKEIHIFSDSIRHADMVPRSDEAFSAGFIRLTACGIRCYGDSITLGIGSNPEYDEPLIEQMLWHPLLKETQV